MKHRFKKQKGSNAIYIYIYIYIQQDPTANRVLQIGTRFILLLPNMVSKIIEIVTSHAIQIHTT